MREGSEQEKGTCVGCGRILWTGPEPRAGLAIACCCGAMAPVIQWSDGKLSWPGSVGRSQVSGSLPHLEYYLGFSSHQSPEKTRITVMLSAMGSYSYQQCTDPECRQKTEKFRERVEERLNRRDESLEG